MNKLNLSQSKPHPCLTCGACCASFRVSFYWSESEGQNKVPAELTNKVNDFMACMEGTDLPSKPRCTSLLGNLGEQVSCAIYANRPSPCREFMASYEDGTANERCDRARASHGMLPLDITDYEGVDLQK